MSGKDPYGRVLGEFSTDMQSPDIKVTNEDRSDDKYHSKSKSKPKLVANYHLELSCCVTELKRSLDLLDALSCHASPANQMNLPLNTYSGVRITIKAVIDALQVLLLDNDLGNQHDTDLKPLACNSASQQDPLLLFPQSAGLYRSATRTNFTETNTSFRPSTSSIDSSEALLRERRNLSRERVSVQPLHRGYPSLSPGLPPSGFSVDLALHICRRGSGVKDVVTYVQNYLDRLDEFLG